MLSTAARSLAELLQQRAAEEAVRYVALDARGRQADCLTGRQLARRAAGGGSRLRRLLCADPGRGAVAGEVVLVIRDPLVFVSAFFAVASAGLVPVPAPNMPVTHRAHRQRLRSILRKSAPLAVLSDEPGADQLGELSPRSPVLAAAEILRPELALGPPAAPSAPVAYVQYTSGSLSRPKPVALSQDNVLAQLRQAAEAFGEHPESVAVTWVPLYHDMGLVTGVLRPLWSGYTSVLLDPFSFVRDPAVWPRAMTEWQATHTSAPDFGYALCARKADPAGDYDLRPLTVARSAGELVRAASMRAFTAVFGRAGFDYAAFTPSYGLAEATLTATACPLGEPPRVLTVSGARLRAGEAVPADDSSNAQEVVSCGRPMRDTEVKVLDPETGEPLRERRVGEIWISGPQVAATGRDELWIGGVYGYRTGDLGFLAGAELYLVGRARERFQIAGENYYSADLEAVAGAADPRLRQGRAAVFLAQRHCWRSSAPVVLAECRIDSTIDNEAGDVLARAIVAAIGREAGLSVPCVWLISASSLPVTTSGKIQRDRCREAFETGSLPAIHRYERGLS
jgi:acyl-CoA synthetase (AMP-forming)/AMP-acid ligase II